MTVDPEVVFKFVPGVQLYVVPPVADKTTDEPEHIFGLLTETESEGAIVIVEIAELVQVPVVPITV